MAKATKPTYILVHTWALGAQASIVYEATDDDDAREVAVFVGEHRQKYAKNHMANLRKLANAGNGPIRAKR